ncbi:MAG: tRNA guanosine(34) transglycosylase Tgt [Planctomycetota bacterium]|jgi:queuine tRNA-ribosyltransferase
MNNFEVLTADPHSPARRAVLTTEHGQVDTPVFMPVGTAGAVKGITPAQLNETGAAIVLANAYHLLLRPGVECIEKLGGLHGFMSWNKPILTDSGGYQVFSLGAGSRFAAKSQDSRPSAALTRIDDEGVEFASHIDGSRIYLTPQKTTQIQNRLGADIIMCFDQCTPFPCQPSELQKAVQRTVRWAARCRNAHARPEQLLFGIVQGGTQLELRASCAQELVKMHFDGYAIGGLGVGEGHKSMIRAVAHTAPLLPDNRPRYLMGVGTPADIIAAARAGVDMFDCVLPTRNGRNAFAFTEKGPLRVRNNAHIDSTEPVEAACDCYCCTNFSRGALRHFFNVGEMLGPILLSLHNLRFYQRLMARIRRNVEKGTFAHWAEEQLRKYQSFESLKKVETNSGNSL